MRPRWILGPAPGLLLLLLLLPGCQEEAPQPQPAGDSAQQAQIDALRRELEQERTLRAALAAELVAQQTQRGEPPPEAPPTTAPDAPGQAREVPDAETAEPRAQGRPWFDADSLLVRGMPPHEVERIQDYFGKSQMQQIELQHQAMREGWFKTKRYHNERRQIDADFRAKIGDEDYDVLLYASGKRNRVVVADVVDRSPGFRAGFEAGDVIIRYDDTRIFRGTEVQRLSSQGRIGESIPVEVLRNGEILRLYIDRGPMGFGLEHRLMWPHHLR